jgi:acylphosphatase
VDGLVQGVGFRWFILSRAQELGVRGWVRNRPDGAVEVVGLATAETIARLDAIVRRGPPGGHVTQVTADDVPHESVDAKSFHIRR